MGFVRNLTGKTQAQAIQRGAEGQAAAGAEAADLALAAGQQAGALLDPFTQLGQQGAAQAGFLTDPQAQFDFLQSNPLFQMGLDNANMQTQQSAAARGRLSAGDTLQQLSSNALLAASPLIQQQKQSIGSLLNLGQGAALNQGNILQNTAGQQGNLLTGQAAALAAGDIGAANARASGAGNLFNLGLQGVGLFGQGGGFGDSGFSANKLFGG